MTPPRGEMACHTQEAIAEQVGITQPQVKAVCEGLIDSVLENQTYKAAALHLTDFALGRRWRAVWC